MEKERNRHFKISLVAQPVKNLPAMQETACNPWIGKIPQRRKRQPTPVFLSGKSHGQRSLGGYNPWGHKESDMTHRLHNVQTYIETSVDFIIFGIPRKRPKRICSYLLILVFLFRNEIIENYFLFFISSCLDFVYTHYFYKQKKDFKKSVYRKLLFLQQPKMIKEHLHLFCLNISAVCTIQNE